MIKYKDLSKPLKTIVVWGWVSLVINAIAFIVGFITALIQ